MSEGIDTSSLYSPIQSAGYQHQPPTQPSSFFGKMKNFGRNGLIVGFLTASIAYYYTLNTYNEKRDRTAMSESFVPIVQYIWGTFAEIIIVSLVYLPSLMFDLYKCNTSTRINPILMTVPAAMSLLQDITFYFALSMVLDS